jgi:predicted ribosomally synthesized peptide with SipW-like signal peptide
MKKIINALSIIAIVAGVVLGTTGAYFSDTEISPTNIFAAGTLELSTDNEYTTMPIEVANVKPGDSDVGVIRLKNIGTITGKIETAIINKIQDNENGCNAPEALDDTTCADPGADEGELDDYLDIILWIDLNDDDILSTSTERYFIAPAQNLSALDNTTSSPSSQIDLSAEESADIKLKWQADPNHLSGNLFQSDDIAFTITFNFRQI